SLKVFATEKPTFLRAGILIGSPVCGFLPMRAFILRSRKMPSPGILTDSPFLTLFWTVSTRQSRISSPCLRLTPPASASFVTNCAFVIAAPPSLGTPSGMIAEKRALLRQSYRECQENPRQSRASTLSSHSRPARGGLRCEMSGGAGVPARSAARTHGSSGGAAALWRNCMILRQGPYSFDARFVHNQPL